MTRNRKRFAGFLLSSEVQQNTMATADLRPNPDIIAAGGKGASLVISIFSHFSARNSAANFPPERRIFRKPGWFLQSSQDRSELADHAQPLETLMENKPNIFEAPLDESGLNCYPPKKVVPRIIAVVIRNCAPGLDVSVESVCSIWFPE